MYRGSTSMYFVICNSYNYVIMYKKNNYVQLDRIIWFVQIISKWFVKKHTDPDPGHLICLTMENQIGEERKIPTWRERREKIEKKII